MAWAGRAPLALLVTALLVLPTATLALAPLQEAPEAPGPSATRAYDAVPAYDGAWARSAEDGLRWSTTETQALVAPLVGGAGLAGWTGETLAAYRDGLAWAHERAHTTDHTTLARALAETLRHAPSADPSALEPDRLDAVPGPFVGPLATLLAAQARLATQPSTPLDPGLGPWESAQALTLTGAWTLGVVDATLPALHAAAPAAPSTPLPLDPFGLVVLGSPHDDRYTPTSLGPLTWQGPILLVEPGGDDTYEVPIAARAILETPTIPVTEWQRFRSDPGSIALELDGDDTYRAKTAAAVQSPIAPHVLVDEAGDDTYGDLDHPRSLAAAVPGFAFLGDRDGNDTYRVKDRGLAYALSVVPEETGAAVAVLADWTGDDVYEAKIGSQLNDAAGRTHARAANVGATGILRDYSGADTYRASHLAFALSNDDGMTLFIDDQGRDSYFEHLYGGGFGEKSIEEEGLQNAPLRRSVAYFLDGDGVDDYEWEDICCDAKAIGNERMFFDADPEERWGIFVDCTTAEGDPVPCPARQREVLERIVESET